LGRPAVGQRIDGVLAIPSRIVAVAGLAKRPHEKRFGRRRGRESENDTAAYNRPAIAPAYRRNCEQSWRSRTSAPTIALVPIGPLWQASTPKKKRPRNCSFRTISSKAVGPINRSADRSRSISSHIAQRPICSQPTSSPADYHIEQGSFSLMVAFRAGTNTVHCAM
jgi:hypothetical protein